MTNKRDKKALVRERMEKTGESYQKALQAVEATAPKLPKTLEEAHSLLLSQEALLNQYRATDAYKAGSITREEFEKAMLAGLPGDPPPATTKVHGFGDQQIPVEVAKTIEAAREKARAELGSNAGKATELMKKAIEAWGFTIHPDGKLVASDGRTLKARWSPETADDINNDLIAFHGIDGEAELARAVLDQIFACLTERPTLPAQNEFEFKMRGQTQKVVRTPFEQELMADAKEMLDNKLFKQIDAAKPVAPSPTELQGDERYRELAKAALAAEPSLREQGCICPSDELGTDAACPWHHPPIVTEPKIIEPEGVVAKGGLSEPGSVDVAQKLVEKAIEYYAKNPPSRAFEKQETVLDELSIRSIDVGNLSPEDVDRVVAAMKPQYRKALGKPPLDGEGRCALCRNKEPDCKCSPKCPPIDEGLCVYCGRMPHACACKADPAGTTYARCTKCSKVYKLFLTKSRTCEHCGHSPVEVVPVTGQQQCSIRSSVTGERCILSDGHPMDTPTRFHRFPPSRQAAEWADAVKKAAPDAHSVQILTDREGNPLVANIGLPQVITSANLKGELTTGGSAPYQYRFNGRSLPTGREPTFSDIFPMAMDEAVPACSCGGATRIGPGAEVLFDDPDCLFHHPFTSEDSPHLDEVPVKLNGEERKLPRWTTYERLMRALKVDPERVLSVTYRGKIKVKCNECDGEGRWFDASHAASKRCDTCEGSGKRTVHNSEGILSKGKTVFVVEGMIFNAMDTSNA